MKPLSVILAKYAYNANELSIITANIDDLLRKIAMNGDLATTIRIGVNDKNEDEVKIVDRDIIVQVNATNHIPVQTILDSITYRYYNEGLETNKDSQSNAVRIDWTAAYNHYKYEMENMKENNTLDNKLISDSVSSSTRITEPPESSSMGIGVEKHCP